MDKNSNWGFQIVGLGLEINNFGKTLGIVPANRGFFVCLIFFLYSRYPRKVFPSKYKIQDGVASLEADPS